MTALGRLCDHLEDYEKGWPDTPRVYQGHALDHLFAPEDCRRAVEDRDRAPIQVGMVHRGRLSAEPARADHPEHTLVLNGLHLTWPELAVFCRRLEGELGHPMTANVYRTPPGEQGFDAHWDTHHVWIAQIEGMKRWRVSKPVFDDPMEQHTWKSVGFTPEQLQHAKHAPELTVGLEAGQVLWIPRGWVHWGSTDPDLPSTHITIGVHLLTRRWAVDQLLAHSEDDPAMRQALPPHLSPQTLPAVVEQTADAVRGVLDRLNLGEHAVAMRRKQHRMFNPVV
jgi:ribosomal protein L16 Arg81 hydroxylase